VKATFWGTRGSLPSPRPGTTRYGGNTACVEVRTADGAVVLLDAGSGIHRLADFGAGTTRVDVLLSHLHMDHILGLGFFGALFQPDLEVHIWGPPSTTLDLKTRLSRYLSPPLFPVRLTDLPCKLMLHDAPRGTFDLPSVSVTAELVCHPGPTLGYRLQADGATLTYIPDHEPEFGDSDFLASTAWTSGFPLMSGVDLLIHDSQYTDEEYPSHVGWGHTTINHAMALAEAAGVGTFAPFHHDPSHNDVMLDRLFSTALEERDWSFEFSPAREGTTLTLGRRTAMRS
jgi:ribonuclease BN (tRNA processing enzyme)